MKQLQHTLGSLLVFTAVLFFFVCTYASALFAVSQTGGHQAYMFGITAVCFVCLRESLRLLVSIHNNK